MKKVIVISFVFLYSIALIQPFLPLINYAINKEYISKVLCENRNKPQMHCNGKCHLNKELKKAASEESGNNSIPKVNLEDYITLHTESSSSLKINLSVISRVDRTYLSTYKFNHSDFIFHPPTA